MIRDKQVDRINNKLASASKAKECIDAFRKDEPVLYSVMKTHANRAIEDLSQTGHELSPDEIISFHNHVCMPYIFMWLTLSESKDLLVQKISSYDMFEQFIQGLAPDKFYRYSTKGLDPESTLYKAKQAKQTIDLERVRHALLPLIAEDVGNGDADVKTLKKAGEINDRTKRNPKSATSRTKSHK